MKFLTVADCVNCPNHYMRYGVDDGGYLLTVGVVNQERYMACYHRDIVREADGSRDGRIVGSMPLGARLPPVPDWCPLPDVAFMAENYVEICRQRVKQWQAPADVHLHLDGGEFMGDNKRRGSDTRLILHARLDEALTIGRLLMELKGEKRDDR